MVCPSGLPVSNSKVPMNSPSGIPVAKGKGPMDSPLGKFSHLVPDGHDICEPSETPRDTKPRQGCVIRRADRHISES